MNIKKIILKFDKTSISFFKSINYVLKLKKILNQIKPDKVFVYAIKPVILGSIAAHLAHVPQIYSLVCGLGYVYSVNSLKMKIVRLICNRGYKVAFGYNEKVIFQNQDDINYFTKKHIIEKKKTTLVNGSGVDLNKFVKNKLPNHNSFIMISRVLKEKGVLEYFEAARIIKQKYPETKFTYVGAYDQSYQKDFYHIQKYIDDKIVEYIPETNKVADFLTSHAIFVLPTYYREGIPKTILEACAIGRPIITTNTPGCKQTIKEGINGYFVKPKDANDLALKMELMLKNPHLQKMGNESYKLCKQKFNINLINKQMMDIMEIREEQ